MRDAFLGARRHTNCPLVTIVQLDVFGFCGLTVECGPIGTGLRGAFVAVSFSAICAPLLRHFFFALFTVLSGSTTSALPPFRLAQFHSTADLQRPAPNCIAHIAHWGHVSTFHIQQTEISSNNCWIIRRRGMSLGRRCPKPLTAMPAAAQSVPPLAAVNWDAWNVET